MENESKSTQRKARGENNAVGVGKHTIIIYHYLPALEKPTTPAHPHGLATYTLTGWMLAEALLSALPTCSGNDNVFLGKSGVTGPGLVGNRGAAAVWTLESEKREDG